MRRQRRSGDRSADSVGDAYGRRDGDGDGDGRDGDFVGGDGGGGGGGGGDSPARPADILFRAPGHFLALGFGAGLSPVAPGTAGALIALPFVFLFAQFGAWACAVAVAAGFAAGIHCCRRAALALGESDHPAIVWDEVVGMWAALCFIPLSPAALIAGFLLFRLFDIAKPWPIRRLERLPRGLGIMLDDLAAAILANLALRILLPYLP